MLLYDNRLMTYAAEILVKTGREVESVMPMLLEAVNDTDVYRKLTAIRALGQIGPKGRAAVPLLQNAVKSTDEDVQRAAADALKRIDAIVDAEKEEQ